ncbi:MAG: DNA-directed RNA polymerase [Candidatus Nanoarchaeia archaeon]|nr:DNA-directed RNA polymerase [Candidatus Nanoarchaeia archaeon]MDD5588273.1 DNA-directed RNA polymerase [Candidatus Nanoarchaeia archaeon]
MFYEIEVKSHIRIPPRELEENIKESILKNLKSTFEQFISQDLGIVVDVSEVLEVGEGVIIPGDGAAYYETRFKIIVLKPEMQEIVIGKISEIAGFGAFMNIGPIDGMIHISQTMDDYVSFTKSGELQGKESKHILKTNDKCRARIIAVSYKDLTSPKIGLTMRQPNLGSIAWIEEDLKKVAKEKPEKAKKEK